MKPIVIKKYPQISPDKKGNFFISGTSMKVEELVSEKLAFGWGPEELYLQHPNLTMAQIYTALAFYSENPEVIKKKIIQTLQKFNKLKSGSSSLSKKISAQFKQSIYSS